jgi:hypothetical protein
MTAADQLRCDAAPDHKHFLSVGRDGAKCLDCGRRFTKAEAARMMSAYGQTPGAPSSED